MFIPVDTKPFRFTFCTPVWHKLQNQKEVISCDYANRIIFEKLHIETLNKFTYLKTVLKK